MEGTCVRSRQEAMSGPTANRKNALFLGGNCSHAPFWEYGVGEKRQDPAFLRALLKATLMSFPCNFRLKFHRIFHFTQAHS